MKNPTTKNAASCVLAGAMLLSTAVVAGSEGDAAMYGNTPSRNMISSEKGLLTKWDIETGEGVLWRQKVGSQTYAGPVVHDGRVYVGTNNEGKRRDGIEGDKGVLLVFDEATGELLWQATHDKLGAGRVNDWPLQGICSTPYIEDGIVYYVSNEATVVAADVDGFLDGTNDGAITDEALNTTADVDKLWEFDLIGELDVFPHNLAAGSPLIVGDILFTTTGNGVDEGHVNIPSPLAPSFVALNKKTGELVWENAAPAKAILHGTWSNPAYGEVNGVGQVAFPGGDGWLYSFAPKSGALLWKYDLNPKDSKWRLGGAGTRNNVISTPVFYEGRFYVGVGQDPEHGEGPGAFFAIDASLEGPDGDVTGKAKVWSVEGEDFNRTISTAAIHDGLLYITDLSGFLYCMELATGKVLWTYDTFAAIWGSPFVADGKVYLGDEDGDIVVLEAGRTKKVLAEMNMGAAVYTTPVAHDGKLFIASRSEVFAIGLK